MFVQKRLLWKTHFGRKNRQTHVCCLCVNLLTVKIWGQSEKFPMSFSFLQCSLQIRRVIFTSGQNLKPPFLGQYLIFSHEFFFYIRDFIWIITLTERFEIWRKLSIWRYTVTSIYTLPKTHVLRLEQYFRLLLINKRAVTTNFNNSWRKPCTNNISSAVLSFFPSVFAQVLTR